MRRLGRPLEQRLVRGDGQVEHVVVLLVPCHAVGAAVVVATHDPEFVERVDRSVALRDGEKVFDGQASVSEVLALVST